MEFLVPIFVIGLSGLLFGRITAYPVDKLRPHPVWCVIASMALTCLHAYLWSLLASYLPHYGDQDAGFQKHDSGLFDFWKIPLLGSLSVLVVQLDKQAEGSSISTFLRTRNSRRR